MPSAADRAMSRCASTRVPSHSGSTIAFVIVRGRRVGLAVCGRHSSGSAGIAVVWGTVGAAGRTRAMAPRATRVPEGAVAEGLGGTRRRVTVAFLPVALVMAALVALSPAAAALIAGVPAGIGAGDLWFLQWVQRFQRERGDELLREVGSPFAVRQRSLYTFPMNDATDPT